MVTIKMVYFLEFRFIFLYALFRAHCLILPLCLARSNADLESTSRKTNGENPENTKIDTSQIKINNFRAFVWLNVKKNPVTYQQCSLLP